MNRHALEIRYDPAGALPAAPEAFFADSRLAVIGENLHPPLRRYDCGGRILFLAGDPIAEARRDDAAVIRACEQAPDEAAFLRSLNGSFLVLLYDPASGALVIGNDRFASLALYHGEAAGRFLASSAASRLTAARGAVADPEAVFEFLALRRLLGEKTFDPGVRYLRSAALLRLSPDSAAPRIETYWQPDYAAQPPRGGALVEALAEGLRRALAMHCSDERRFGLLLSGGLDSRALLAAASEPLPCVTTALARNNEVAVAAEVAAAAGAEHHFLERPAALHEETLDDAVFLTGGMQVYTECQFLGYGPRLAPHGDCWLIGLGLDIFFGGLYLPKEPVSLFGREALHHRLLPLGDDLAETYITGVKYRLRTSDPFAVVKRERRGQLRDSLRASVQAILARGRALGAEGLDLWEYLHLHNLSRHYSFPMMASIRSYADCRAPALENDLFDLAIAMTAEQKLDGTPYQQAIARLGPAVMRLRNANTNLRADLPLKRQTAAKAVAMARNRLFGTPYPQSPGWRERSWPSPKAALEAQPGLMAMARALPRSERLASLDLFDLAALQSAIDAHDGGRHDHAILLNLLLTIERALAAGEAEAPIQSRPDSPPREAARP